MPVIDFALHGDHIPLAALLKVIGIADSGGSAKAMVARGDVQVDGQLELRKSCKIRAGQTVAVRGTRIRVLAVPAVTTRAPSPVRSLTEPD